MVVKHKDTANKVPGWVVERIRNTADLLNIKANLCSHADAACWIYNNATTLGISHNFIDHWGRCGDIFYTEPYNAPEEATQHASRLAMWLDCKYRFSASSWCPPHTVRVEFYKDI
jgi:hypothetical protein